MPASIKSPPQCPYCKSPDIVTNRKSAYWRCESCGQLWHPDRLPRQIAFPAARDRW